MGRYQRGSIRRVGNAWEWRYRCARRDETRVIFPAEFPNDTALSKHLEPAVARLNSDEIQKVIMAPTMGDLAALPVRAA